MASRDHAITVGEMIEHLRKFPSTDRVLVEGNEIGYHDANPPAAVGVVLNKNAEWRDGPHDAGDEGDRFDLVGAVLICRYNPGD